MPTYHAKGNALVERISLGGGLAACRPQLQVLVERKGRSGRSQHASLASMNEGKGLKKIGLKKNPRGMIFTYHFFIPNSKVK